MNTPYAPLRTKSLPVWLSNPLCNLAILAVVILLFYSPSIFAEISLVDDIDTFARLARSDAKFSAFWEIFFPRVVQGGYYRPLLEASFMLDKLLSGADPRLMHLENVLLHLLNVILVYRCTRECLKLQALPDSTVLPMLAGLLFGLHPIVTESVNWISGRTDILMGNFVLLSLFMLLKYKHIGGWWRPAVSITAALAASLAKEAAFGYLVGGLFIWYANKTDKQRHAPLTDSQPVVYPMIIEFLIFYGVAFLSALFFHNYWVTLCVAVLYGVRILYQRRYDKEQGIYRLATNIVVCALVFVFSLFLAALLRKLAFVNNDGKISQTIKLMLTDPNYSISVLLGALGFYLKKFFFPTPLNFFILEIDPLYDFAGIAVTLSASRLLLSRGLCAAMAVSGLLILLPALPFAFGTIAWTGYAERYIYLPAAFWLISGMMYISKLQHGAVSSQYARTAKMLTLLLACILPLFAFITFQRNIIWQKNVTLLRDTFIKTPRSRELSDYYMAALIQDGRMGEAKEQYRIGSRLYTRGYNERADLMMAAILVREKRYEEAYSLYNKILEQSKYASEYSLSAMMTFLKSLPPDIRLDHSRAGLEDEIGRLNARRQYILNMRSSR